MAGLLVRVLKGVHRRSKAPLENLCGSPTAEMEKE